MFKLNRMSFILQVFGDNLKYQSNKYLQKVNKVMDYSSEDQECQ